MPTPRPTMGLHNLNRQSSRLAKGRVHRSSCKLCPEGVYTGQPAVWLTDPMGLSHAACAQRAGIAVPA